MLKNQKNFVDVEKVLNVKEDENELLRSYSRLKNANINQDTKFPIMICKEHKLSEMLVNYYRLKVMHRGTKQTLNEMRTAYWITRGRNFVKRVIKPCITCNKLNSRPYKYPEHSDLPETRFVENYPFDAVGVDYLGPLLCLHVYGDVNKLYKAWVVIYMCATTRSIILDVAHNAGASCFIKCFSRLISRRGCPSTVLSDNGSVFTAEETQRYATNKFIRLIIH